MSQEQQGPTPAGWYQDGAGTQRWWDGTQWGNPAPTPKPISRTQFIRNPVLRYLYLSGGIGVVIGLITGFIASANVLTTVNPFNGATVSVTATIFQGLGFGCATLGVIAIIAAAVVHATSWEHTHTDINTNRSNTPAGTSEKL